VTFRFLDEHRDPWPLRLRCDALDVSAAGSYAWRDRPASARPQRHDALRVAIRALQAEFQARYGSPRVPAERAARGHDGGVNTVAKFMRGHDLRAKTARKCRCTTDSNHDLPVADHLLDRQCDPASPNAAWLAGDARSPYAAIALQHVVGSRIGDSRRHVGRTGVHCCGIRGASIPAGTCQQPLAQPAGVWLQGW